MFNFLSKLMQAANCVGFYQNHFCREVREAVYLNDKNNSDKAVHNLQLTSAWIISLKTSRALHSPFFSFLHNERNIFSFYAIFSGSIYRVGVSVYEVSYPWLMQTIE